MSTALRENADWLINVSITNITQRTHGSVHRTDVPVGYAQSAMVSRLTVDFQAFHKEQDGRLIVLQSWWWREEQTQIKNDFDFQIIIDFFKVIIPGGAIW